MRGVAGNTLFVMTMQDHSWRDLVHIQVIENTDTMLQYSCSVNGILLATDDVIATTNLPISTQKFKTTKELFDTIYQAHERHETKFCPTLTRKDRVITSVEYINDFRRNTEQTSTNESLHERVLALEKENVRLFMEIVKLREQVHDMYKKINI